MAPGGGRGRHAGPSASPSTRCAPAGIAYTSGTTGHPKGAVHSQHNLLVPGAVLVARPRLRTPRCARATASPSRSSTWPVLTTLLVPKPGGCSVIMDRIDAGGVAEWIRTRAGDDLERAARPAAHHGDHATRWPRPTWPRSPRCGPAAPTAPRRSATRSRRSSGCPSSPPTACREAPTVVSIDGRGRPARRRGQRSAAAASRRAHRGCRRRVVPAGELGEVCLRPADDDDRYHLMLGYWERPEASAEVLAGGDAPHRRHRPARHRRRASTSATARTS